MKPNTIMHNTLPKYIVPFICVLAFIFLTNCSNPNNKVSSKLNFAEGLVDEYPDSVLVILDSISLPEINNIETKYQYKLLEIQAKYKTHKDITADTAIFSIKDHYVKNENLEKAALATLYCGLVLFENNNREVGMHSFVEATKLAESTNNAKLKGYIQYVIAKTNSSLMLCEKAIPQFNKALKYFVEAKSYGYQIGTLTDLGNNYLILNKKDTALNYYAEGLELAKLHKDSVQELQIKINMSVAHREMGNIKMARLFLNQALREATDSVDLGCTYFNLAKTFADENRDSSLFYANKSLGFSQTKRQKRATVLSTYNFLSQIEEKAGNKQKASNYRNSYIEKLNGYEQEKEESVLVEVEKKYNIQVLQNINKQLIIKQQWFIVVILLLLLSVAAIVFLSYRYYIKNKQERQEAEQEKLETEQKIDQLKESAKNYNSEQNTSRNLLLKQFDIMKKVALLDGFLREEDKEHSEKLIRKFNEIVYGKETSDWSVLYESMNNLEDGFYSRMQQRFPLLDEIEFKICCLTCAQLSNTEIGIILKLRTNTIHARKTIIRRKIGLGSYGHLSEFIHDETNKQNLILE